MRLPQSYLYLKTQSNDQHTMGVYLPQTFLFQEHTGYHGHGSIIGYHAFSYPALISSVKKLCMRSVRALERKCTRVACHCQKTAGGCIDFRWSTNIQLVVMRYQQYLSMHTSVCYFRQHVTFSRPLCAIIIHPVNMTNK